MGIQLGKCQRWNRSRCTRAHIFASAFGSSCMGLRLACWSWCLRKYCRKWILITLLCYRDGSTTSLLWKKEGDQGMNWKEAKVDLPADGGLQYSLVFASDMVTQDLRCVFFLVSSLFYCFLLFFVSSDVALDDFALTEGTCSNVRSILNSFATSWFFSWLFLLYLLPSLERSSQ